MMGNDLPKFSMLPRHHVRPTRLRFFSSGPKAVRLTSYKKGHGSRLVDLASMWQQVLRWSVLLPALYFYLGLTEPLYPGTGRLCESRSATALPHT